MNSTKAKTFSDTELLLLLKEGNQFVLKSIYDTYWKSLYLSAFSVLKDTQQAEDIVQDIFLQLWIRKNDVEIKSLKAYLFTAVKYKVISFINSAPNRKVFIEDQELEKLAGTVHLGDLLEEREIKSLLDQGIMALPERCQQVFILSRKEHLNNKEIAERMGISTKTVENQITIALRHLKISLGDYILFITVFLPFF
ncbi:MAG: RNA polymerase sigma-70 factor [Candidatus Pedobacter colombiensis]|uniref:RNA polymerase sigma-70 factor n=1 Tax=Candidatus Pedobacter colombiensis TaxID=3121371 RepID=A0AAJ5W7L0_9SPHI|nr:RNA polymerase sigma-70 factor [Pedobacter sp.]WEK18628.1 MAG: RNA polymerase sigma-70 factor [Pedobacter sp.]